MKSVVEYDLSGKTPVEKTHIIRVLFGYWDKSNHGKYKYFREGLVSKIPGARQIKGAILADKEHEAEVIRLLKKYKIKPKVTQMIARK